MSKIRISLFSITLFTLVFTAQVFAAPDLRIGFIGPLTGNAAILGIDALPAIQIAIEEEKKLGTEIELYVEDDQYTTRSTISAYKKLTSANNVDALILLTYGGLFALKDSISHDGVLVIDTLDCDDDIAKLSAPNILCLSKGTEDMGEVVARAIISRKIPSVSFIYFDKDPFMGTLAKATRDYLEHQSTVKIIGYDGYADETDFRSILLKSKKNSASAYIFYGYDTLGHAMRQARDLRITEPFYSVNSVQSPGFQKTAGNALEGTLISTYMAPRGKAYEAFLAKFEKKTGKLPSFEVSTFPSYDAIKLLAQGVREYQKKERHIALKEFLTNYFYTIRNYNGLAGTISIDKDGATRTLKNELYLYNQGKLRKAQTEIH